jgi:hypothetical protein
MTLEEGLERLRELYLESNILHIEIHALQQQLLQFAPYKLGEELACYPNHVYVPRGTQCRVLRININHDPPPYVKQFYWNILAGVVENDGTFEQKTIMWEEPIKEKEGDT